MALVRPRLTDHHGIDVAQEALDFAIPLLDEDIPLYVDPFLLWKSPSQQDTSLHLAVTNAFNHLGHLVHKSRDTEAREILVAASECAEAGLGLSRSRVGTKIGPSKADEILALFRQVPSYAEHGFTHPEEIQLYVQGISADRVSDFTCSFIKSWLIDYTTQVCGELGVPLVTTPVDVVYDHRAHRLCHDTRARLPVNPTNGRPLVVVPKRWLRHHPWINFDDYYKDHCPLNRVFAEGDTRTPVKVLTFNRDNFGVVQEYIRAKERTQADCKTDPLFRQIPVTSAKSKLASLLKLPTGKTDGADREYEDLVAQLLASLLYPDLDFAEEQSRTVSGRLIRDLLFYNNRSIPFLKEIHDDYGTRQLVFEIKNVAEVDSEHINQLNRYLDAGLGRFGVLVTRHPLKRAMRGNTIDLWSGQRKCIVLLTDSDLELMVNVFESKQRAPIDVLKRAYVEFRRECPS